MMNFPVGILIGWLSYHARLPPIIYIPTAIIISMAVMEWCKFFELP